MSYTPQTWANGDIITATKLNNIESGVQSVSNSYTPTTWVNGDIITATKLNNIEQGIANAGGGSSDFSTAEVTVISNVDGAELLVPRTIEAFPPFEPNPRIVGDAVFGEETTTLTVVLYKGYATAQISSNSVSCGISAVTGDITINDPTAQDCTITGDGTITIA